MWCVEDVNNYTKRGRDCAQMYATMQDVYHCDVTNSRTRHGHQSRSLVTCIETMTLSDVTSCVAIVLNLYYNMAFSSLYGDYELHSKYLLTIIIVTLQDSVLKFHKSFRAMSQILSQNKAIIQ